MDITINFPNTNVTTVAITMKLEGLMIGGGMFPTKLMQFCVNQMVSF